MPKKLQMTNTRFTAYSILFMIVGMGVVGIPLFLQSKGYYDETQSLSSELAESKSKSDTFIANSTQSRVDLIDEYNVAVKDRNTLLRVIERTEGDLPNWQPMQCKDGLLETPIDC